MKITCSRANLFGVRGKPNGLNEDYVYTRKFVYEDEDYVITRKFVWKLHDLVRVKGLSFGLITAESAFTSPSSALRHYS